MFGEEFFGRRKRKSQLPLEQLGLSTGAPGRIRTRDPLVRSQVLYPTELPARERGIMQNNSSFVNVYFSNGGEGGIRTPEARFMSLHP